MQQLTEKGDKVIVGLWVMILMVGLTAVIVGELGTPAPVEPMGVWITDINGIPVHQTAQIGHFRIFEITGGT
jgi:hypothetical protein